MVFIISQELAQVSSSSMKNLIPPAYNLRIANAWGLSHIVPCLFHPSAIHTILPYSVVTIRYLGNSLGPSASQAGLGWVTESPAGAKSDSVHAEVALGRAATVYWLLVELQGM